MATLEAGDEVILPAPYFVSYPEMTKLFGGVPVVVECPETTGFKPHARTARGAITPTSKWLFLNMPGNPSGAVYSRPRLQALGKVLAQASTGPDPVGRDLRAHPVRRPRFVSFGLACPN
jgi:aspartate aminotransferase